MLSYSEKKLDHSNAIGPQLSVRLSVTDAVLHSFNRERSIIKVARKPKLVAAEIGGLSFIVNDISEWRGMYKTTDSISQMFNFGLQITFFSSEDY